MQCGHRCVGHCEQHIRLQSEELPGICLREIGIATSYAIFDLEIATEYPPLLSESGVEKVSLSWLSNESPDKRRTALSARSAEVDEHRNA